MVENMNLQTDLQKELDHLKKAKKHLITELSQRPEGILHIRRKITRKQSIYHQYYLGSKDNPDKYIPVSQRELAISLAQKDYENRMLSAINERIIRIRRLLFSLERPLEDIYNHLSPIRREMVSPITPIKEVFISDWYRRYPGSQNSREISSPNNTDRGEIVRSKSEKILADFFFHHDIPYIYEPMLVLMNGRVIFPDFFLLNVRTYQTYIFEHFGMMGNEDYAGNAINKINDYIKNGYLPGDSFLYSFEADNVNLDMNTTGDMILHFLK